MCWVSVIHQVNKSKERAKSFTVFTIFMLLPFSSMIQEPCTTHTQIGIYYTLFLICFVTASNQFHTIPQPLVCSKMEVLKYFRFSSMLSMPVDRCHNRQLPSLVSSLYACRLTHPHYITIRLPLKVIPLNIITENQNHKLQV